VEAGAPERRARGGSHRIFERNRTGIDGCDADAQHGEPENSGTRRNQVHRTGGGWRAGGSRLTPPYSTDYSDATVSSDQCSPPDLRARVRSVCVDTHWTPAPSLCKLYERVCGAKDPKCADSAKPEAMCQAN
jgi:hypothetical protein